MALIISYRVSGEDCTHIVDVSNLHATGQVESKVETEVQKSKVVSLKVDIDAGKGYPNILQ